MPVQTDSLVMVALGVQGEQPQNALQPRLPDGVHLRWAFPRAKGFPWYGYYLFRRPHEFHGEHCLVDDLARLPIGPLGKPLVALPIGTLSSDANLVTCDDFPAQGASELDLSSCTWVRCDLPSGESVFRVDARIGFREHIGTQLRCVRFDALPARLALKNPFALEDVRFRVGIPPQLPQRPVVSRGKTPGLEIEDALEARLPEPVDSLELSVTLRGEASVDVLSERGAVIATRAIPGSGPTASEILKLQFDRKFSACRIVVTRGSLLLHRFCYPVRVAV